MKKAFCIFLSLLMVITIVPASTLEITAAETVIIKNAKIDVDVPVNGIALKTDARIVGRSDDGLYYWEGSDDMPFNYTVAWYSTGSGTPLANNTKAVMGSTYIVSVFLEAKSGYEFSSDFGSTDSYINGVKAKAIKWTDNYYEFTATYSTIAAVSGNPIIQITKMQLSPYEGNPAEIVVDVKNATNVRYQWIYSYGDGGALSFSGNIEIMDSRYYEGCHTNHFKQHSYFGDTWDEDMSFCKIKCRVTCDAGTFYTQEVWYTLIDRTVATNVGFELDTPVSGGTPDRTAVVSDSSVCTVTSVDWYGPENQNGQYPMVTGKFSAGRYYCRINVKPNDEYKFGEATNVKVNSENATYGTISGYSSGTFYGPDSYYVIKYFDVVGASNFADITITEPEAGTVPKTTLDTVIVAGSAFDVKDIDWSYYDETDDDYYLMPEGMTFEAGKTYELDIEVIPKSGYLFPENKEDFSGKINGKTAIISGVYSTTKAYLRAFFTVESKIEIGNAKLFNGQYLLSGSSTPTTEAPTDQNARYAYFKNGVLYLNNFDARYDTLQFFASDLKIEASGYNTLGAIYDGSFPVGTSAGIIPGNLTLEILENSNITLIGESFDAYSTLRVYGDIVKNGKGEFVVGTFGNVYSAAVVEPKSITVNNGDFIVVGSNNYGVLGLYGDAGELTSFITVNGGLFAVSGMNVALSCCTVMNGNVLVNTNAEVDENICAPWDKTTSIELYKTVYIRAESDKEPEYLLGDVNEDSYVDNLDAAMILKYDAGIIDFSDEELVIADVNSDGYADNLDAAMILKYDAGLINGF